MFKNQRNCSAGRSSVGSASRWRAWVVFVVCGLFAAMLLPSEASAQPEAPSALTATAVSSTQINLAWSDNSSNETGFKVERKTGMYGAYGQIATTGANTTSYQDTGLMAGTLYYYRVCATNAGGDSSYSNEASATTQGLPTPWEHQDIGAVAATGTAAYAAGTFTVEGSGAEFGKPPMSSTLHIGP